MSSRDLILERVRANLAAARARGEQPVPDPRGEPLVTFIPPADRVAAFVAVLESVGGRVHRVAGEEQAAAALAAIVEEHGARRIGHSNDTLVESLARGLGDGIELVRAAEGRAALIDCELGITGAQYGIAETGTLVLLSDSEEHRLASLVPPVHVAILHASAMLDSLEEALARISADGPAAMSRAVTFITGPSRTADIELRVVVGVHGPKVLHLILITDL